MAFSFVATAVLMGASFLWSPLAVGGDPAVPRPTTTTPAPLHPTRLGHLGYMTKMSLLSDELSLATDRGDQAQIHRLRRKMDELNQRLWWEGQLAQKEPEPDWSWMSQKERWRKFDLEAKREKVSSAGYAGVNFVIGLVLVSGICLFGSQLYSGRRRHVKARRLRIVEERRSEPIHLPLPSPTPSTPRPDAQIMPPAEDSESISIASFTSFPDAGHGLLGFCDNPPSYEEATRESGQSQSIEEAPPPFRLEFDKYLSQNSR